MQPALERRDRDRRVQERRDGDADGIEAVEREQVLPARDVVLDPVLGGELCALGLLEPGDADQIDAVERRVGLDVLLAGPADAHDADTQRGAHSNHPVGDCGLPSGARRSRGAAHCTPLASTRLMSGWW